jgi:hypothetical protein
MGGQYMVQTLVMSVGVWTFHQSHCYIARYSTEANRSQRVCPFAESSYSSFTEYIEEEELKLMFLADKEIEGAVHSQ